MSLKLSVITCAVLATTVAQAQTSRLYMTAQGQNHIWGIRSGSVDVSRAQAVGGESALAVFGDIRTLGVASPGQGARYDILANDLGTRYNFPLAESNVLTDGTTDGVFNYAISTNGAVFQLGRNWEPNTLPIMVSPGFTGVTYDFTDDSFWLSGAGNRIEHYSRVGGLLGSFQTTANDITFLALDHADGSLWTSSLTTPGTLYQYSKAGSFLGSVVVPEMAGHVTLGGDFEAVPEPASIAALAFGICALIRRRNAKSKPA